MNIKYVERSPESYRKGFEACFELFQRQLEAQKPKETVSKTVFSGLVSLKPRNDVYKAAFWSLVSLVILVSVFITGFLLALYALG